MSKKEPFIGDQIEKIVDFISQEYGKGIITTLGGRENKNRKIISSGSLSLDEIIGGGYVYEGIVEFWGKEASGKTTLALLEVLQFQKAGKKVAYIDLENGLNLNYAKNIGIEIDKLLIIYPEYGEQALKIVSSLIKEGINLVVVDSIAALVSKAELEGDLEKQTIGSRARIMSNALPIINKSLSGKEAIVIFINQIRSKISTGFFAGNPETTMGGRALSYFANLRVKLIEKAKIEKNGEYIGIEVQAQIKKNKFSSPYKETTLEIIFGQGIQKTREIINLALRKNIIQKNGAWYSYKEKRIGNGKEQCNKYLIENQDIYQEIEKKIVNAEEVFDKT